jgi:hypothetical protein
MLPFANILIEPAKVLFLFLIKIRSIFRHLLLGQSPVGLVFHAAALLYDYQDDEEAMKIQSIINQNGIETAIEQITKLDPTSTLFQGIIKQYNDLRRY